MINTSNRETVKERKTVRDQKPKDHGVAFACVAILLLFSAAAPAAAWLLRAVLTPSAGASRPAGGTAATATDAMPQFIIDPGHGGEDGGCVGIDGSFEKDINLRVALALADILRMAGCEVSLTRTDDRMLYDRESDYRGQKKVQDLAARLAIAREHPDAFFVSIHMNSYPSPRWSGLQVWYSKNDPRSEVLADSVQAAAQAWLDPKNSRRIKAADGRIYLLDRAVTPAVLIECGFLSNPEECARLGREEYQKDLALTIAAACLAGAQNKAID